MGRDIHCLKMKKPAVMRVFSTIARSGPSTCHQALIYEYQKLLTVSTNFQQLNN